MLARIDFLDPVIASKIHLEKPSAMGEIASFDKYTVPIDRNHVPKGILHPSENRSNTHDFHGRNFEMIVGHYSQRLEFLPVDKPDGPLRDAREMRREYFDLEKKSSALCDFLNRWGLWHRMFRRISGTFPCTTVFPNQFWEQREEYRRALVGTPRKWLTSSAPLKVESINEPPYFLVERSICMEAVQATITIDHLSNVKFGICKRSDCRRLYERRSRQKRLYCSPECAHLANVRKLRAKKKKTESKKGPKRNAKG